MLIKISSFPISKVLIAWIALLLTLVWMLLIIAGNYFETVRDGARLLLFPALFAILFLYLSVIPQGYRVYYDADNLRLIKKGKSSYIPLKQVGLLEYNQATSFNPFGSYNNCCITFMDADGRPSCVYFYSNKIRSFGQQKAINHFIATVKQHNPEFRYDKQLVFLKLN